MGNNNKKRRKKEIKKDFKEQIKGKSKEQVKKKTKFKKLKRKNILLITTKLCDGGAEKNVCLLADELVKDNNVFIVTFDNSKQDYYTTAPVIDMEIKKSKFIIKKIINTFKRIKKLKQIKEKYKIDCSISFLTSPNLVNALSKKNEKVIISIRNYISMYNNKLLYYIANKIACNKADKIVCVSESVKKDQNKNYKIAKNKLVTIYNSCKISNQKKDLESDNVNVNHIDEKYKSDIITIGRLTSQKGQWHLIKAFKFVVEKYPETKMIILGKGKLEKYLLKLIKKNKLEKNIELKGFVSNTYDYLANSKIFVLPSVYEGLPNVILEAMSNGLPVIATDCYGGNREIIHPKLGQNQYIKEPLIGKYGILVPNMGFKKKNKVNKSEKYLAEYIIKLLKDEKLRKKYSLKSIERVQFFNEENKIKLWKKII